VSVGCFEIHERQFQSGAFMAETQSDRLRLSNYAANDTTLRDRQISGTKSPNDDTAKGSAWLR
jgi:hypothetical protein